MKKIMVLAVLAIIAVPSIGHCWRPPSHYHHYYHYPRYYGHHYRHYDYNSDLALTLGMTGALAGLAAAAATPPQPPPPQTVYVQPQIQTTPPQCQPWQEMLQRQVRMPNGQWVTEYGCFDRR